MKTLVVLLFLLSGCVQSADEITGPHPPMLFVANNQAHILILVGGESGIPWSDISITPTGGCQADAPTESELTPGQAIHILGDTSQDCTFTVAYQGVKIGSYDFGPKVQAKAEVAVEAVRPPPKTIAETKPTSTNSTAPPPQQTNSTVPP